MKFIRVLSFVAAMPLLAACAGWQHGHVGAGDATPAAVVAPPDTVTLRLAEAAERAANALGTISGIEQGRYGSPPSDDFSGAPPELMEPVTLTWVGPAEQLLATMAARAGYQFRVLGARPTATLTVSVDEYQQPLLRLVKSAAIQVSGRADVVVDAGRRVMELRYAPDRG